MSAQTICRAMELPGARLLTQPAYRRFFRRPYRDGNIYYGIYEDYATALRAAAAFSSDRLPATYDVARAGRMYRTQLRQLRICDYAALLWLEHALADGARGVFDLGGHIGLAYYGFGRLVELPADLDWQVHDLPGVMATGREWAAGHDIEGRLRFADSPRDANGCDLLISSGTLQYLEYELPDLLAVLDTPPRHVLINLSPIHPERGFFTLQNLGIAVCPYRVIGLPALVEAMGRLGYAVRDQWELPERQLRIPFAPERHLDHYSGLYFRMTRPA